MSARRRLYALLCEEIAIGYPKPWWPQDLDGWAGSQNEALDTYLGLLHDAVASIPWGEVTRSARKAA